MNKSTLGYKEFYVLVEAEYEKINDRSQIAMYYIARNQNEGNSKRAADKVTDTDTWEKQSCAEWGHGQRNRIKLSFLQMQKTEKTQPAPEIH